MTSVETLKPTQEDREAAARLIEWHNKAASDWHTEGGADLRYFATDMPEGVRKGIWDDHPFVQAFARHRLYTRPNSDADALLREAKDDFAHLVEYWNRDRNDKAMHDACWHTIEVAEIWVARIDTHLSENNNAQ